MPRANRETEEGKATLRKLSRQWRKKIGRAMLQAHRDTWNSTRKKKRQVARDEREAAPPDEQEPNS